MRPRHSMSTVLGALGLTGLFVSACLTLLPRSAEAGGGSNYACVHHSPGCKMIQNCSGSSDWFCSISVPNSGNCQSRQGFTCSDNDQGYNCNKGDQYNCGTLMPTTNPVTKCPDNPLTTCPA
jgi:hypothetical protein